jgi:hypothetical protein
MGAGSSEALPDIATSLLTSSDTASVREIHAQVLATLRQMDARIGELSTDELDANRERRNQFLLEVTPPLVKRRWALLIRPIERLAPEVLRQIRKGRLHVVRIEPEAPKPALGNGRPSNTSP